MSNPVFEAMSGASGAKTANGFMAQVQAFAKTLTGDPKQIVEGLMKSGKLSQQDFNRYAQMTDSILGNSAQNAKK